MRYVFLLLAILGELVGTNLLKASNGFSSLWKTLGSLAAYGACFYFLDLTMKAINLNVAYALWAGGHRTNDHCRRCVLEGAH